MRAYNIYYGSNRLNTTPVTATELADIKKTGIFIKKARMASKSQRYPMSKCRVVEVVIL